MDVEIRNRAVAVRKLGTYIGFFEWVAWAALKEVRLEMLFGNHVLDLLDFLAPWVASGSAAVCRVAVVEFLGPDKYRSASLKKGLCANHFVAAKKTSSPLASSPSSADISDAKLAAMKHGWMLLPTDATGNCGIDAMCQALSSERSRESWLETRREIADFMDAVADVELWQELWANCAENALQGSGAEGVGLGPPLGASCFSAASGASSSSSSSSKLPSGLGSIPPSCISPKPLLDLLPPFDFSLSLPPPAFPPPTHQDDEVASSLSMSDDIGDGMVEDTLVDSAPNISDDIGDDMVEDACAVVAVCDAGLEPEPVAPPVAVAGRLPFAEYIMQMPLAKLTKCSSDYEAWRECEREWLVEFGASSCDDTSPSKRRHPHRSSKLQHRLVVGRRFALWLETDGKHSKSSLKEFLLSIRCYADGKPPKNDRVWLASCLKAWRALEKDGALVLASRHSQGGRKSGHRVPDSCLQRVRGRQGSPYKCPELRFLLWDWFVDIRRSLATIVTPKLVLAKAKELSAGLLKVMRSTGHYTPLPQLDKHWLLRWKREFGVVLRRPNLRFKCSKEALCARLRAMWLNVIRVRHLAVLLLDKDLDDQIYGIDEKPVHFNEAGSKGVGTLEIQGAPAVRLKENHAATRERVSVMTSVTSNPLAASSPTLMPLELLCKAKTNFRTRSVECPRGLKFSLAWAEKGSYRQEHILAYLRRWLDPWSEQRALRRDWRILFLDVAKSHCGPEVLALCHERGYVLLFHYGCTTGVAQVNDTDLHGPFEKFYVELEQASFNIQQTWDPGCVSRSLQAVVNDVGEAWRLCDHKAGVRGHKFNGLNVALDGSEDHLLGREAATIWKELDMAGARLRAIEEVNDMVKKKEVVAFSDWQKVVRHPANPGVVEFEGAELEDGFGPEEPMWLTAEEEAEIADEGIKMLADDVAAEAAGQDVSAEELVPLVDEAEVTAQRVARLKKLRAEAMSLAIPAAVFTMDRHIKSQERALAAGQSASCKLVGKVLMSHMAKKEEMARKRVAQHQARARKVRRAAAKVKAKQRKAKAAKAKAKKEKAEYDAKLDALPKTFSAKDCGQDGGPGLRARIACLERLKMRSPPLNFEDEARWLSVRDAYCAKFRRVKGLYKDINIGVPFIGEINAVLEELAELYKGPSKFNTGDKKGGDKKGGDPLAFKNYLDRMASSLPKPSTTAVL